ncbi:MAG: hypothetical protein P4L16_07055 [Chlamydiales bacterium]|nr:hypothetical protein [Chlamydiales bacterium]
MSEKQKTEARQKAIKELIQKEVVSDQRALVELLEKNYSIETNQAVVSRDLRKLGVVKKQVGSALLYELPSVHVDQELLKLAITDIQHNEVMIVIDTGPGLAACVGEYLDKCSDLDILGCLSGENVVFVVPRSIHNIAKVFEDLCEQMFFKRKEF